MIHVLVLLIIQHAIQRSSATPCHPFIVTSSDLTSGNISSPNYPNPYPPDADCTYLLQGSDWQGIKIIFHDFDLEPPYTAGCLSDYIDLDIYDLRDRMTFHRRFCGGALPAPLLVLHPKAKLVFRTNHAVHHRGFFATFEFVNEGEVMTPKVNGTEECGQQITEGGGGVIQFPGGKQSKRSLPLFGLDCVWLLRVEYAHRIYIRVQSLEFQGSVENCQKAQLGIYDGYEHSLDESTVLKKFCGDQHHYKIEDERAILSTRNRILVRFQTHRTDSTKDVALLDKNIGFRIVWSEVSSEETTEECMQNQRFACQETRACISKDHLGAFSVCPELIYCISQELVCDGVSHCAETDASDENSCFTRSLNALIIGGPASLLVILLLTFCTIVVKRKKLLKRVRKSFLCWKDQRKRKAVSGFILDNPIHSPFIGLPRSELLDRGQQQTDNSSVESASICPLSDSESSDVSICPFHGTKFMNHLPVLHEVYNLHSDGDSSPNDPTHSPPPPPPPAPAPTHLRLHPHHPPLHSWRLKTRPMTRTSAVCLSDTLSECRSSSGEEEPPCLCGPGNKKTLHLSAIMNSVTSHHDKATRDDSGVELHDSFDLHSNHSNEPNQLGHHHLPFKHGVCQSDRIKCMAQVCPSTSTHRGIQTDEEMEKEESGPPTGDEYEEELQGGVYSLSPRVKVKVNTKVKVACRDVGTNTQGHALHSSANTSSNNSTSSVIFAAAPAPAPVKIYKPLCSTVTTFGVYPESTSTDV